METVLIQVMPQFSLYICDSFGESVRPARFACGALAQARLLPSTRVRRVGVRFQGNRNVFMNGLAFVVVLGMRLPVGSGDGLRGFVGLESQVADLVLFRQLVIPET